MIRLACALQLASLGALAAFLARPTGATATAFTFLGMPLLGLSILTYVFRLTQRRAGKASASGERRPR